MITGAYEQADLLVGQPVAAPPSIENNDPELSSPNRPARTVRDTEDSITNALLLGVKASKRLVVALDGANVVAITEGGRPLAELVGRARVGFATFGYPGGRRKPCCH
jgi:hypothetical protein